MNYVNQNEEKLDLARFNNVKVIQTIAMKTKMRPEHVSLAALTVLLTFFFLTGLGHKILLLLMSFLYPAYKSFVALESEDKADDKRWLVYWIVFGFVFAFKNLFWGILSLFPGTNLILSAALVAIYSPLTNGYVYIYEYAFKPTLKAYQTSIRKYIDMAKEELQDKASRGGRLVNEKLAQ